MRRSSRSRHLRHPRRRGVFACIDAIGVLVAVLYATSGRMGTRPGWRGVHSHRSVRSPLGRRLCFDWIMVDISRTDPESHVSALGSSVASDLFQILRDGRPRTRTELSAVTGLARSTVALRIDALMRLGLVAPVGDAVSTGGRPSSQFAIAASGRSVLGVDVGASHVRIAVSDLTGRVLEPSASTAHGCRRGTGGRARLGGRRRADAARGRSAARHADLLAIGVGLPGPVEHSTGRPINPPIMPGWDRFDVPGCPASAPSTPRCSSTTTSTSWRSASASTPGPAPTT